jgi:acetyl-CoA carboxylase biotin carboxyl carrier protein
VTQSGNGAEPAAPAPERVADLVRSLASVMRQSSITELDLDVGPMSVRLRRPGADFDGASQSRVEDDASSPPASAAEILITAPMIGTFYTSATPGAQPFVNEGDEVFVGQTIGIIEAMKIMNEIAADSSGVVDSILVGNGQPVEYGSPLMRLRAGQGQHS